MNCRNLKNPTRLPATTLAIRCYQYMFFGCASMEYFPELPAEELAEQCYYWMFSSYGNSTNDTRITDLSQYNLPAKTLKKNCYAYMFQNCTKLISPPKLPATNLVEDCYQNMFCGSINLTKAPDLPAVTLETNCYYNMFSGCIKLNHISAKFTDWNTENNSTYNWVENVSLTGNFYCPQALDTTQHGPSRYPEQWTVIKK